jgi:hypothetical protein
MSTSIPTFTNVEWYNIKGRGDVANVYIDRDCEREKLRETFQRVILDGKEYEVLGVEAWAIHMIRKGAPIGFLVGTRC